MAFVDPNLENVLNLLNQLKADSKPQWGTMSAQQMIEHLSDLFYIALGEKSVTLVTPEEKLPKLHAFIESEDPMPRNFKAPFVTDNSPLRHEELELAIDEFVELYLRFEDEFEENPSKITVHPIFGPLNYTQWCRLNQKHLTHHFLQFGLITD